MSHIIMRGGVKRNSNIELLRIISMLLVLLIHFTSVHLMPSPETLSTDAANNILNLGLRSISFVCVNCFILISGYFGIRWKIRSFSNLIFQILFWLAVGVTFAKIIGIQYDGSIFSACLSMINGRWFIPAYISLYVVAPLLNAFIEKSSTKQLLKYIVIFYIFSTIYGYFMFSAEFNEGMSLISLIGIYLTGAYLHREDKLFAKLNSWSWLGLYFTCALLLIVTSIVLFKLNISSLIFGYLNPLIILQSVFLFMFFERLKIGKHRWINFIAASAFAVYLFHFHPMVYGKYQETCRLLIDETTAWLTVPLFFIAIFAFCVIVDHIRILLFKGLCKITPNKTTSTRNSRLN